MSKTLSEDSEAKRASAADFGVRQLFRRPAPVSHGVAIFEIKVFEDDVVVEAGDGAFKFDIPSDLDGAVLIDVEAWITGVSSSGDVVVSFYNNTQTQDMLSTPVRIDVGEKNDKDSGTPFVIDLANDDVAEGDEIWVNIDNAGTGALGLGVKVAFAPATTASIALQGAKGDPGGMSSFQGAWTNTTIYQAGDIVTHNGILYIALQDHTSNAANDEPGVGTNWEDFWAPLIDVPLTAGLNVSVFSSVNGIADGVKAAAVVPFDATISEWWMLADTFTDAEVDIWKTDYAGYPPSVGDSIVAAAPPTLSTAIKNQSSALTGWTTTVNEGDILSFYFSGVTLAARITIFLGLEKT